MSGIVIPRDEPMDFRVHGKTYPSCDCEARTVRHIHYRDWIINARQGDIEDMDKVTAP